MKKIEDNELYYRFLFKKPRRVNEFFEDIKIVENGYQYEEEGYFYLGGLSTIPLIYKYTVVGMPTLEVKSKTEAVCCKGRIGSFEYIPWKGYEDMSGILVARDHMMIANPWVGIISEEPKQKTLEDVNE